MGSEQVDGIANPVWFEFFDDTVDVDPSSAADRAFLAGLRARAVSHAWSCDPVDTYAHHPGVCRVQPAPDREATAGGDNDHHLLRVGVWLDDWPEPHPVFKDGMKRHILTFGLEFDGTRIVGDQAHHDIPFDIEGPTEAAMDYSGSLEFLVERASEWFEWLLSLPIERHEWFENGALASREYVLPVPGLRGPMMVKQRLAPRPADRITLVRGVPEPSSRPRCGRTRWWGLGKRRGK